MQDLKIRFLIVDDDKNIRRLCTTIGTSLGFACAEADSGQSALQSLDTTAPDIILADLMMPNMSGLEFLDEVKNSEVGEFEIGLLKFVYDKYPDAVETIKSTLKMDESTEATLKKAFREFTDEFKAQKA